MIAWLVYRGVVHNGHSALNGGSDVLQWQNVPVQTLVDYQQGDQVMAPVVRAGAVIASDPVLID